MKRFFWIAGIFLFALPLQAEKAYIFTEEGEIIEGEVVSPEELGIGLETLEIMFVEEGAVIIEKIVVEEEFIEEGSTLVLLEEEGNKFISAYESPWEGEEEEIPAEEETFPEEEFEY
jgi:hypothetical protein